MSAAGGQEAESDIPPALTPNEWANVAKLAADALRRYVDLSQEVGRPHAAIAILNDELHDEDPRKLTRETAAAIRRAAEMIGAPSMLRYFAGASDTAPTVAAVTAQGELYSQLLELADVIESYLAPRDTNVR